MFLRWVEICDDTIFFPLSFQHVIVFLLLRIVKYTGTVTFKTKANVLELTVLLFKVWELTILQKNQWEMAWFYKVLFFYSFFTPTLEKFSFFSTLNYKLMRLLIPFLNIFLYLSKSYLYFTLSCTFRRSIKCK